MNKKESLKESLKESMDEAEWNWLIPHSKRDVIIVVSESLDLIDVALAISMDSAKQVESWIQTQLLQKPSEVQIESWNQTPERKFLTVVVQPFVLIQEKKLA